MQNRSVDKECSNPECEYNWPYMKRHIHCRTNDGEFIKFIIEQPKTNHIQG